jgi:hypothetical protein
MEGTCQKEEGLSQASELDTDGSEMDFSAREGLCHKLEPCVNVIHSSANQEVWYMFMLLTSKIDFSAREGM